MFLIHSEAFVITTIKEETKNFQKNKNKNSKPRRKWNFEQNFEKEENIKQLN